MPVDYGLDRYRLDRGIDSISRNTQPEVPLPDAAHLPPAAQLSRPELDRLLWRPNLQDYLAEQLQPEIADRQLLTPQRFERTLRAAVGRLRELAAREGRAGNAQLLGKAAQALAEEANLRELLNMYRSTLFQG
jgi:type III secretion protein X